MYPKPKRKTLGAMGCAARRMRQFPVWAETEKYPHVTFFLNGGAENAVDRRRPLYAKVANCWPPMTCSPRCHAAMVTEPFRAGDQGRYDFDRCVNYANPP